MDSHFQHKFTTPLIYENFCNLSAAVEARIGTSNYYRNKGLGQIEKMEAMKAICLWKLETALGEWNVKHLQSPLITKFTSPCQGLQARSC